MFARQPDIWFYIGNIVVKQDLRSVLNCPKVDDKWTKGMTLIMDQNHKNPQKSIYINTQSLFLLIVLKGSKTDSGGQNLKMFLRWRIQLITVGRTLLTTKIWFTSTDLKNNPVKIWWTFNLQGCVYKVLLFFLAKLIYHTSYNLLYA